MSYLSARKKEAINHRLIQICGTCAHAVREEEDWTTWDYVCKRENEAEQFRTHQFHTCDRWTGGQV